jgi:hypothetical protein
MSDLESYVIEKVVNGHCDCMFPVNTYQWNLQTILALFAPKPLLFANSDNDGIFPMTGNRRIAKRMRECYELLGAKDNFDDYVSKGGHAYRPDLRLAIFGFFHKHLLGSDAAIKDADFPKIEGKDLRVFPEDKDLPKDSINAKADELFITPAKVKLPTDAKEFATWKTGMVKQLREKCFRALPDKVPAAEFQRLGADRPSLYATEPGILVEQFGGPRKIEPKGGRVWVILNPDEDSASALIRWGTAYRDAERIGYFTRGGGASKWTRKNPPNTVERSLVLNGQTVDSGAVRDAMAVIGAGRPVKGTRRVAGRGPAGVIAAYAALFLADPVDEVVILDPPISHRDGPHFLNVLRVVDIPEALGLLAPDVKLTLVGENAKNKAFDRTEAIYKAAGAADKFKRE